MTEYTLRATVDRPHEETLEAVRDALAAATDAHQRLATALAALEAN